MKKDLSSWERKDRNVSICLTLAAAMFCLGTGYVLPRELIHDWIAGSVFSFILFCSIYWLVGEKMTGRVPTGGLAKGFTVSVSVTCLVWGVVAGKYALQENTLWAYLVSIPVICTSLWFIYHGLKEGPANDSGW